MCVSEVMRRFGKLAQDCLGSESLIGVLLKLKVLLVVKMRCYLWGSRRSGKI